jgi:ABC-type transport system involved in multi-copper enzyme maturation permease subunit
MKNIYTLSLLTFREALSKKIFLFFFSVSSFVILIFALIFAFTSGDSVSVNITSSGTNLVNSVANGIKMFITYPLYAGGLFISIFSVAGFIPSLLEKGNIDLILSKPVSRNQVILGKFFGGTAMVFVNIFYAIFFIWLLIGLKFNVWDISFLLSSFTITLAFASIYALIILLGIITRSSMLPMVISYLTFFAFSPLLASRESLLSFSNSKILEVLFSILYYLIPQTSDLSSINTDLAVGGNIQNIFPVISSI